MHSLYTASGVALALFMVLATIDGVYLHLWRYRLYARAASRTEHRLHTLSALLFVASLPLLLLWQTAGLLLWAGIALLAVDAVVEVVDMGIERRSRAALGGLTTFEYILHVLITSARVAALALGLAARPGEAWATDAPLVLGAVPGLASTIAWQALPGAVLLAALHVWLCTPAGIARLEAWREPFETPGAAAATRDSCCVGVSA